MGEQTLVDVMMHVHGYSDLLDPAHLEAFLYCTLNRLQLYIPVMTNLRQHVRFCLLEVLQRLYFQFLDNVN